MKLRLYGTTAALFALFLAGCAYLNTFYNAKTYFYEAEKEYRKNEQVTGPMRIQYNKAIEKCAKVIELYPRSRYVDDAIFIMGVSYLRLGELGKARRKFEELLRYYPESKYAGRAKLELARVFLESGELVRAKDLMKELDKKEKEEGEYYLAQSFVERGNYEGALDLVKDFLKLYPKSPFKKRMLYLGAKAAMKLGEYELARNYLDEYLSMSLKPVEKKEGQELLGDLLLEMKLYDEALDAYSSIDLPPESPEAMKIELKKAKVYEEKGEIDKAKEVYRSIFEDTKSGVQGIEAKYRLAVLLESEDSLEEAQKLFDEASKMYGQSEFKEKASLRAQALQSLLGMEEEASVQNRVQLAELYLFELNKPEEALKIFEKLYEEDPSGRLAPKILYSILYTRLRKLGDFEGAKKAFKDLEEKFPNSIYYQEALKNFPELSESSDEG